MNERPKELATKIYEFVAQICQENEKAEDVVTGCATALTFIARDCGFTQNEILDYIRYLYTVPLPPIEDDNAGRN